MGKGKEIPEPIRKTVIKLRNEGNSLWEIGRILNLKKPTVQTIIKNFKESGNYESKPRAGRPRILDERTDRAVVRLVKENPKQSAVEINRKIKADLGVKVSDQTIRRTIKKNGYNSRVARRKPLLRPVNIQKRLEYAQKYQNIHVSDPMFWERVIFTDECKFMVFGGDGRAKVWRKPNAALEPQNINPTVKHGGGSVMVWGCMAANGVGKLRIIDGIMDKAMYIGILKDSYLPSVEMLDLGEGAIFLQDNDPKHSSKVVKEWLLYNVKHKLEHPPQSPDLNVIEHLWDVLKRNLRKRKITSTAGLKEALMEEWSKITPEITKKLALSMPSRLADVIKAKGGHTKY